MKWPASLFTLVAALTLSATAGAQPLHVHGKLTVVATFSILGDFVHQVAGDRVTLVTLVGPGGDTHVYEPSPSDATSLASADLVVVNGLGFEGWLDRLVDASGYKGDVVVATRGITPLTFGNHSIDPHAWQSVPNAQRYIANINKALDEKDPANAAFYDANAQHYTQRLQALDAWVREQMGTVPVAKRSAITSHDALGYFGATYGIHFIAPLGLSTASDASASDIAHLVDQLRSQQIKALFLENMSDPRLIRQLARDGGAVVGGTLYSDALSPPDGEAANYLALFRHNVETMVETLKMQ